MSGNMIFTILLLSAGACFAEDSQPEWQVKVGDYSLQPINGKYYVRQGDKLELICMTVSKTDFLFTKQLRLNFQNSKADNPAEISEQGAPKPDFKDEKLYLFSFKVDPTVHANFTVLRVTDAQDGVYKCIVRPSTGEDEVVTADIVVVGGIDNIKLMIDGQEFTGTDVDTTLQLVPDTYSVQCESSGSNPQPLIHLHVGDKDITGQDLMVIDDPDSTLPRKSYKATMAVNLKFDYNLFNKKLMCHSMTNLPKGVEYQLPEKSASVTLQGIVDKPTIACSNTTATVGDHRVTLRCAVSYAPKIKTVAFNIGNEYILYPGNTTQDLLKVTKKDFNETHEEVVLQFHHLKSSHFVENIYLDVEGYDGKKYQYPVYLIQDVSGAAKTWALTLPVSLILVVLMKLL